MKRLYEKSVRLQSVIRTWPSYGESENTLSAGLVRKLMWLIASIVLDKDFFYGKFDAVIPIPKKTISVKKSGDIIKAAQHIVDGAYSRDKENLCPGFDIGEDLCYQFFDDTISLGEVCGKYWNTEVWGNTTLLSNDLEFYDFNDFFQKLSETKCSVTPELFAEWRAILQDFVTEFIPPCIASDMVELLLKKRRKLFFETISTEPHLEVFKKDFEWDTINMMVDILRFGENNSDKEIRGTI